MAVPARRQHLTRCGIGLDPGRVTAGEAAEQVVPVRLGLDRDEIAALDRGAALARDAVDDVETGGPGFAFGLVATERFADHLAGALVTATRDRVPDVCEREGVPFGRDVLSFGRPLPIKHTLTGMDLSTMESFLTDRETGLLAGACLAALEDSLRPADGPPRRIGYDLILAEALAGPSRVSESAVNKAVEEEGLSCRLEGGRRVFPEAAALYLGYLHSLPMRLDRRLKPRLFAWFDRLRRDAARGGDITGRSFALGPMTTVRVEPELRDCLRLLDGYVALRERYIHSDPGIMGGVPVIRGTRIPAQSVLSRIEGGDSLDDLLADYPEVPRAAFEAAITYARTHPRAGRPKRMR